MLYNKSYDDPFSRLATHFLVSSPKENAAPGGFFDVNLQKNTCKLIADCDGRGIAPYRNGYIGASRNDGIFFFDHNLKVRRRVPQPYLDIHGLQASDDGLLYASETAHNRIGIYSIEPFERVDEIVISPHPSDHNHINDLLLKDGYLLISMFSYGDAWRSNWDKGIFDGVIIEYDLKDRRVNRVLADKLKMPHTIKYISDDLVYCESFSLNVVRAGSVMAQFSGYTRGMAFDGCYYFIGQSRMRHWGTHHEPNLSLDSGIHVLDPVERTTRFITLPSAQVYDIAIV